ncbi:hypothetical protein LWI28_016671 [Acer negundo]|uniref:non-specific serine/threonine protein kinase n=1 Tax=Acer negundo TaxID=4023 RepID=A0AAD5IVP0_ACENE|nr:hypothetical protein LWI28_016671 [Acer negundo]
MDQRLDRLETTHETLRKEIQEMFAAMNTRFDQLSNSRINEQGEDCRINEQREGSRTRTSGSHTGEDGGINRDNSAQDERVPLASFNLEGDAQLWFQLMKEETPVATWEVFKQGLHNRYGPTQFQDFFGDLTKLQQMGSVKEYQTVFERLLIRAGKLTPAHQVGCFVSGLKKSIKTDVQACKPESLTAAIGLAREPCRLPLSRSHDHKIPLKQGSEPVCRLNILIDVASALEYLHFGYSVPIVHCDIKPSNVLLDQSMVGHLSDFGITKLLGEEDSMTQTQTLATIGYMAPEYGSEGRVSRKSDIYSYGIMLMETFTRKKPTDETFIREMSLRHWVGDSLKRSIVDVADSDLLQRDDVYFSAKEQCVSSIFSLAMECTTNLPENRISIRNVISRLVKIKATFLASTQRP